MSELINNSANRQRVLKELIAELHDGKTVDDVRQKFADAFQDVSAADIAAAEQILISEGMPVTEVQRLCDVHAAVFKGSIEEIHRPVNPAERPGHPVHTFRLENRALEKLMDESVQPHLRSWLLEQTTASQWQLSQDLALLAEIDLHYVKKENVFFPYLEQYGITAPPKVMWGVDDEIRSLVREPLGLLQEQAAPQAVAARISEAMTRIREMIFKEENILEPMLLENMSAEEWARAAADFAEIGYAWIDDVEPLPSVSGAASTAADAGLAPLNALEGDIVLPSGVLKIPELVRMLDTLPFDITFVDKDDEVKYFSQSAERIFPRSTSIIGRKVANCHPPKSVHVVEKIVADFKSGRKDHEDFWIKMADRFVLIRYYAVRDQDGSYLGTLEVTQDIAPIQMLEGEKRLMES